ncbi:MAG: radical SAM protein [Magnetococcales bacterium]|nr:radical SAM protein [Magnetococcales bacterium]
MSDNILFIVPPPIRYPDYINPAENTKTHEKNGKVYGHLVTEMPLGIIALSAYIKKHTDAKTKLIDFSVILNAMPDFPYDNYADFFDWYMSQEEIKAFKPTIIGISVLFSPAYPMLIDLATICRKIYKDALIVSGGSIPQNMYQKIFDDLQALDAVNSIDALCYGEGEKPLLALVQAEDKHQYLKESRSWITVEKKDSEGFVHDLIEDLDEIPFYDYDICDMEKYSLNPSITTFYAQDEEAPKTVNFQVMTSRGCPYHCTFCASHTVHGRNMRYFSVERIREDFQTLRNKYGAKQFIFQDDHLMGDIDRVYEIIEIIKNLKDVRPVFQNGLAMYALTREMLEKLVECGVEQLTLPVESGNSRVLKQLMKKPLKLDIIRRVTDDCRDLGIYTNLNLLIGMPGETKDDIQESIDFLKTLNSNWFVVMFATPLVGSEMLEVCIENGYLTENFVDTDYKKVIVKTEHLTPEEIYTNVYSMNLQLNFVENPDYRLGEYETALLGLKGALIAKRDHAFAHYYSAKCYEKLGDSAQAEAHFASAKKIIDNSPFWKGYADKFNLEIN